MWVVERSSEATPEIEDPDRLAYETELTSATERSRLARECLRWDPSRCRYEDVHSGERGLYIASKAD